MNIIITGWKDGFRKVELNKILRKHYGFSIKESKDIVDAILRGEKVVLKVESLEDFQSKVIGIGICFEPLNDVYADKR